MKGLLLTNDFPPMAGGEARYYARLCQTLPPADVIVLAPALTGAKEFDRAQAYRIERRRVPLGHRPAARSWQLILFLVHGALLARREHIQKVHVGHLYLGPVALALRRLYGIPYVVYLHGGEMAPYLRRAFFRRVARQIVERAEMAVVNSSFTRRHFEAMGIRHPRTVQLTMAVDLQRFGHQVDPSLARARYGLDGCKVLLTVGRLVERKGHDTVIRAMGEIAAKAGPLRYLIAGDGPQGSLLRKLAQDLGVGDAVRFLGRVADDDLPALYASCDVFVMPSRELPDRDGVEGFGIAFLEAAAAGRPSVGARSGGIPDAIVHGTTGLLVSPDNIGELAAALVHLLTDTGAATTMGEQARDRVRSFQAQWQRAAGEVWQ